MIDAVVRCCVRMFLVLVRARRFGGFEREEE